MNPKLFIETSVFNFYFEGKQGQKQQDAIRLFAEIARGRYEAYTSETVASELEGAFKQKYRQMKKLLDSQIKDIFKPNQEAENLADLYIAGGIIPATYRNDALHIADATVHNLDFVISYNMGHIVKTKTMIAAALVNLRHGYRHIGLSTPTEVVNYDR